MCYSKHQHHYIDGLIQPSRYRMSSPLVVESVVLHSLVREIPKLVVRCGHMGLIALNDRVLVFHLAAHSLQIHDNSLKRPYV